MNFIQKVYEYIKVNSKGLQEQNCKVMAYKILLAIQSLHIMGICHLDIKPDNILIYGDNFELLPFIEIMKKSYKVEMSVHMGIRLLKLLKVKTMMEKKQMYLVLGFYYLFY